MANKTTSQWACYEDRIKEVLNKDRSISDTQAAKDVLGGDSEKYSQWDLLRTYIRRNRKRILD
jgi:hypothetical protein